MNKLSANDYLGFLIEIKTRIRHAQYQAFRAVNNELLSLYWDLGESIHQKQKSLGWGKSVVETLARDLQAEFPGRNGFSAQNLWYMRQFYSEYQGQPKLQPLVGEISWAKNLVIMARCKDVLEKEFYLRATARFGWTKAVLQHQIDNQSYAKYLLNQTNFDQTLPPEIKAQAVLAVKDHYTFDFLGLADEHSERELELALVAIELKVRSFQPEHKGKMKFYLEALDTQERLGDENPSIGIIICRDKNKTVVEYALRTARRPIGVATYTVCAELPEAYRAELPSPEAIAERLKIWDRKKADDE